jgi:hypothetical protein
MGARGKATNIWVVSLIFLIFLLSTDIDHLIKHFPVIHTSQANTESVSSKQDVVNPAQDQCNACFFNQLLNQCLFPVLGEPEIAEAAREQACLFQKPELFTALGHQVNRGPPLHTLL